MASRPTLYDAGAADWIAQRRLLGLSVADMPAELKPASEEDGYSVQAAVIERLSAAGWGPSVGFKVGITTPQMQAALGLHAPVGGTLLAHGRVAHGATIPNAAYTRLGIECEMAFVLQRSLGGPGVSVDVLAAADAVASLHVAIELVDDRYDGAYSAFGIPAIVADNAFHSGFVLGDAVADWRALDLAALRGFTRVDGIVKHAGVGADVLGHPLNSLAWMANCRGRLGKCIEAGAIVLTGSLPVVYWASPGERIEIEIEQLGALALSMEV
jgi:2-keto-4-pentenoate hydratase